MTGQPRDEPAPSRYPWVQGHCPACGGTSLFLGEGGYLTCSRIDCPQPDAASTLLEHDPRTATTHCTDTGCTRGHRTDRYQDTPTVEPTPEPDGWITIPKTITATDAKTLRAAGEQHFADHIANGSICIHSATRVAETIDKAAATPHTDTTKD